MKGWVYIITNKAMPDLIKVGFSTKDPELRAREFGGTHSPHPYIVEYEVLVNNPYKYEQLAHKELESYRENKEWFRCGLEQGISAIRDVIGTELINEDIKHINRQEIEESIKQKEREEKKERENAKRIQEEKIKEWERKRSEGKKRIEEEKKRREEEARSIQIERDRVQKQKDKLTIKRITEQIDADTKLRIEGFPHPLATYFMFFLYVYMILLVLGPTFSTFLPYVNYLVMIWDDGTFGPYGADLELMLFWAFAACLMYVTDLIREYTAIKESSNKRRGWGLEGLPYFTNTKIKQLLAIFLCLLCVIAFSIVITI
jgi:hypothetical protein